MRVATDFEMPLFNIEERAPTCAHNYVTGTKKHPQQIKYGNMQWDNAMLECASPVFDSCESFVKGVTLLIKEVRSKIPTNVTPVFTDIMEYSILHLVQPQLMEFGCDPDFNAWEGGMNEPPISMRTLPYRTAGFHLHIDTDKTLQKDEDVVQVLDFILGLPLIINEPNTKFNRREMYGKAGSYRPKSYGIEWRVPSPYFLRKAKYLKFIWHQAQEAVTNLEHYKNIIDRGNLPQDIQVAINNKDKKLAVEICQYFGINTLRASHV